MKRIIEKIIKDYLQVFKDEEERLINFQYFIESHEDSEIFDWNNFEGHIVASAFVYCKSINKFFVLYHKDLEMYVYPGGHVDSTDKNSYETAKRELFEETGISNFQQYIINDNYLIPLDIDTHVIGYNKRLNLPSHYHFDFRYLFIIDDIKQIKLDENESRDYKWINYDELSKLSNCGVIVHKLKHLITK